MMSDGLWILAYVAFAFGVAAEVYSKTDRHLFATVVGMLWPASFVLMLGAMLAALLDSAYKRVSP